MTTQTILHVHILDSDGTPLADVDASSTVDALAYFLDRWAHTLVSRRYIDPQSPTQAEIDRRVAYAAKLRERMRSTWPDDLFEGPDWRTREVVYEERSWDGAIDVQLIARVGL